LGIRAAALEAHVIGSLVRRDLRPRSGAIDNENTIQTPLWTIR
jgi:hypothetical protein